MTDELTEEQWREESERQAAALARVISLEDLPSGARLEPQSREEAEALLPLIKETVKAVYDVWRNHPEVTPDKGTVLMYLANVVGNSFEGFLADVPPGVRIGMYLSLGETINVMFKTRADMVRRGVKQ